AIRVRRAGSVVPARGWLCRVHGTRAVVARRVHAVPRAPRARGRALLARVARTASRSRAGRARRCAPRAGERNPLPCIPPVGRRRAVARRTGRRGRRRLRRLFTSTSARVIAEDLGVVPDFVRESLARLQVPGYRVLRWEREWHAEGQPFRDPSSFPATSVATTGTHDTETLAEWWDTAPGDDRHAVARVPILRTRGCSGDEPFGDRVRDAFLEVLFAAGADFVIVPIQDLF